MSGKGKGINTPMNKNNVSNVSDVSTPASPISAASAPPAGSMPVAKPVNANAVASAPPATSMPVAKPVNANAVASAPPAASIPVAKPISEASPVSSSTQSSSTQSSSTRPSSRTNFLDIKGRIDEQLQSIRKNTPKSNKFPKKTGIDRGFPKPPVCDGPGAIFDNRCFEGEEQLKIVDAARDASENVTNAAIHFGIQTGAVGLNKVLDILSFAILGLENLSIENKDEILERLEEKMILLQYLANDEESKRMVKKLFGSLAVVIMEGSEVARVPLMRAFKNITDTTFSGINNIMENGTEFLKNSIKIIPGLGDAYIILDNALAVGVAGSHATALMSKNADDITKSVDTVISRVKSKVLPRVDELDNSMSEINRIRNDLSKINVGEILKNVDKNVQQSVAKSIQETGDNTTRAIQNVTPRFGGNKRSKRKSVKSSFQQSEKKKTKRVRFNI